MPLWLMMNMFVMIALGPKCVVLGPPGAALGRLGTVLGPSWGPLGDFGVVPSGLPLSFVGPTMVTGSTIPLPKGGPLGPWVFILVI